MKKNILQIYNELGFKTSKTINCILLEYKKTAPKINRKTQVFFITDAHIFYE